MSLSVESGGERVLNIGQYYGEDMDNSLTV